MSLIDLILLGIALGVDCFVVSFSQGLIYKSEKVKNSLILACVMGAFQGFMPFIGYFGTEYIHSIVEPFSKAIVFTIFFVLGLKFILEAFQPKKEIACVGLECVWLGIATSIDALVSGASLNLTSSPLILAAIIIGIISFLMSMCGFWLGNFTKVFPSKYMEITGGLILIFLAFSGF